MDHFKAWTAKVVLRLVLDEGDRLIDEGFEEDTLESTQRTYYVKHSKSRHMSLQYITLWILILILSIHLETFYYIILSLGLTRMKLSLKARRRNHHAFAVWPNWLSFA